MALNGDGGDESFAGYERYLGSRVAERMSRVTGSRLAAAVLSRALPDSLNFKSRLRQARRFLSVASTRCAGTRPLADCYARWVSFPGHGSIVDPVLNIDGDERQHQGYITDLLNGHAVEFLRRQRTKPFALFFAHKAVHPDAFQAADGTIDLSKGGYRPAPRHADLYKGAHFPRRPNAIAPAEVVKQKPAWTEAHALRILHGGLRLYA